MKPLGRPPLTTTTAARIAEHQAQGMTQAQTAAALGISLSAVRKRWTKGEPGNKRGSQHAERIAALVAQGKTDKEIAEAIGVSVSTANRQRRALKA